MNTVLAGHKDTSAGLVRRSIFAVKAVLMILSISACATITDGEGMPSDTDNSRFLGSFGSLFSGAGLVGPTAFDGAGHGEPVYGHTDLAGTNQAQREAFTRGRGAVVDDQTFSMNFVNVEIQDFVRVTFEEILRENVVVDPALKGSITVRTASPVSREAAVDVVRSVLANTGATLTESDGIFRVSAAQYAAGRSSEGSRGSVRILPLKHIDADQARGAIQPFSSDVTVASVPNGSVLVLVGADNELERVTQVLASLDVDQMRDRSFALIPLYDAGSASVANELNTMFGAGDGKSFRAYPVQRMNAVLLVGRSPETFARAREWVLHLDQAGADERKVHVYPIQNRRASELANILQNMLGTTQSAESAAVAPKMAPASITSETAAFANQGGPAVALNKAPVNPLAEGKDGIAISADDATNSIVVIATPDDYKVIERAIRRLDIMPTQVLIEATIAEVTLNDDLSHGVRWYFESGNHGLLLADKSGMDVSSIVPGFNYVFSVSGARLVIDALEELTNVEVISSPALTVLDNQTATLKVGDQVPVATRSAQSVGDPDAPLVNEIEMKDTGIILEVKPRVNASGLVQLDISQEISDVVATTTSSIDSPTIRQRAITSTVVVQSGTEIVLGGLISQRRESTRSGIPILKDIPIIGEAFTSARKRKRARTELLIMIRPVVLVDSIDVQAITAEIRARIMEMPHGKY